MCGLRGPGADLIAGLFGECPRATDRILPFLADADCRLLMFRRASLAGSRYNLDPASGSQPTTQIPNLVHPSSGISA